MLFKSSEANTVWVCQATWGILTKQEAVEVGIDNVMEYLSMEVEDLVEYIREITKEYQKKLKMHGIDPDYPNPLFNVYDINPSIGDGLSEVPDRRRKKKKFLGLF